MTSDHEWDPSILDDQIVHTDTDWYDEDEFIDLYGNHSFNNDGSYKYREITNLQVLLDDVSKNKRQYTTSHISTTNDIVDLQLQLSILLKINSICTQFTSLWRNAKTFQIQIPRIQRNTS
jgi:hypothetical protein